MTRFLALLFALLSALAMLGALTALLFLPDALAEFEREPEDVYLLVFWAVLLSFLGLFWMAVAVRSYGRPTPLGRLGRAMAALVAVVGGVIASVAFFEPYDALLLIGLGLLCISSAGIFIWLSRSPIKRGPA